MELLIAMGLSTMVIVFAFGLYLFVNKHIIDWQEKAFLNDQTLLVAKSLSASLEDIETLEDARPNRLAFTKRDGNTVAFALTSKGEIQRNNIDLIPASCEMSHLGFSYLSFRERDEETEITRDDELDDNLNFELDGEELNNINAIEYSFEISYRTHKSRYKQILALRNHLDN